MRITNYRAIKSAEFFPTKHNVFLGPNNSGKTARPKDSTCSSIPELTFRSRVVDENDFYGRLYRAWSPVVVPVQTDNRPAPPTAAAEAPPQSRVDAAAAQVDVDAAGAAQIAPDTANATEAENVADAPVISVEAVLDDLSTTDEDFFRDFLIAWDGNSKKVIDATEEGTDPFETGRPAICVRFEARYDPGEDDFKWRTCFVTDSRTDPSDLPEFNRRHKRHVGFLIYRDFRALTRPITLDSGALFGRLLSSQDVVPRRFDDVLSNLSGALEPIASDTDFASILNSYKAELERFLLLSLSQLRLCRSN